MARPTLGTAPTADELAAVACPVDAFALITRFGRTCGTLPSDLHDKRLDYLAEALAAGKFTATAIAARAGMSLGRLSQLAKRMRTRRPAAGQESTS